ncbi:MAG: hypothetical protein Roseis2KO_47830 [Roseivirga sp.]
MSVNRDTLIDNLEFSFHKNEVSTELIISVIDFIQKRGLKAIWHPVAGFICLNIGSKGKDTYRLHIWHPNGIGIYSYHSWPIIHQHRWLLKSYVVKGKIINNVYSVNHSSDNPTHSVYSVWHKNSEDLFVPSMKDVAIELESSTTISTGQFYEIQQDEFHSTTQINTFIGATLVRTTSMNSKSCVLGPVMGSIKPMNRIECSLSQLNDSLESLRSAI